MPELTEKGVVWFWFFFNIYPFLKKRKKKPYAENIQVHAQQYFYTGFLLCVRIQQHGGFWIQHNFNMCFKLLLVVKFSPYMENC